MSEAPARKQIPNTIYDQMVFPDYEFREFPMSVPVNEAGKVQDTPYRVPGKPWPTVIVNSQDELDELRGPGDTKLVQVSVDAPMRVENEDDIRKALYIQADQAGVTIDKRWSVTKIEDTLKKAAADKDVV